MSHLRELFSATDSGNISPYLEGLKRIRADREAMDQWIAGGGRAYGFTTLFGHRDSVDGMDATQDDLLAAHLVPGTRYATPSQSRAVSAVKLSQLATGGTSVSPGAFRALLAAVGDANWAPQFPLSPTYSSGDVIPGAWWTLSLRSDYPHAALRGDTMALINGSYVHVGLALELVRRLREMHQAVSHNLMQAHSRVVSRAARGESGTTPQAPVSIRAIPIVISSMREALERFEVAVSEAATSPSGNPLLVEGIPLEQASFLAIRLSTTQAELASALGFLATVVARTVSWIARRHERLSVPGENPLGLIQWPKAAHAVLNEVRTLLQPAAWALSGVTSEDVEDLWTGGVLTTLGHADTIEALNRLNALLAHVLAVTRNDP